MSIDIEAKKNKIREELDKIKYEFKIEVPKKIAEAREYGDLKENAEYHAARERQGFLKAKIAQLTEQMAKLSEIDLSNIPHDSIAYGSIVTVLDLEMDDEIIFNFVSQDEVDPSQGKISLSSPIGNALQGCKAGQQVDVKIPAGIRKYKIIKLVTVHGDILE